MFEMDGLTREIGGAMCFHCRHYDINVPFRCAAFPQEIPDEVWYGTHTEPFPGDGGLLFEELSEDEMHARIKETEAIVGLAVVK